MKKGLRHSACGALALTTLLFMAPNLACRTWLNKDSLYQTLRVEGAPPGAKVELIGSGKLLASVDASKPFRIRKARGLVLRVTYPGYTSVVLQPDPKREDFPIWAALPLWPYGISIMADYYSGARYSFEPSVFKVEMSKPEP